MNTNKWHKLEWPHSHPHIKTTDQCLYFREYLSKKGYKGGQTNSLIKNFKKSPDKKQTHQWPHRTRAIKTFSKELEILFNLILTATITAIPTSTAKNDPQYDNRFEDLFTELKKSLPKLTIEWPVEIKRTTEASHKTGQRQIRDIKSNYIWKGLQHKPPEQLFIIDDVLTTGAHFRAISDFLNENKYTGQITGVFWAKAVVPEDKAN